MIISRLDWDSNFFGFNVGKVCVDADTDPLALTDLLPSADFDVVYLFLDHPSPERLRNLEQIAPLYDIKLTYRKTLEPGELDGASESVIPYYGNLSEELFELTLMSGVYSRFYLDPEFKPHFSRLYKLWMERSLERTLADQVFVYSDQSRVKGFVTVSGAQRSCGQIGLVAVHPDNREMGMAQALLTKAENWYIEQGCIEAIIVTQGKNIPACRLYEKLGYHISSRVAICHHWK